jgi:NADP-dependent 3-hydroxy acid dehydrogenase YdfG
MKRRQFIQASTITALFPASLAWGQQGNFPNRPIKTVSPYAAGGGPDIQLRQAAPHLGEALKQSIVVENKVGAAGVLAAQFVAQSTPDGYTLLLGSNIQLIQKILKPELSFDPMKDFAPICNMYSSPTVMVVSNDSPYKTVDDVIAAFGTIDVLINNAGVFLPGAIAQESDEDFELQMALNLNASYYLTKRLIPNLAKGGYVFNICSTASEKAYANGSSYCISKHALLGFTRVLRAELMSQGIAVSAVLPGPTLTDSWQGTELPASRFIKTEAISSAIFMAWENRSSMVMEQSTLRPMLGDI